MSTPLSLIETLSHIPDPRKRRGQRHPLTAILSLTVLAMLSGCKSYAAISQFGRDKGFALAHVLGFRRGKIPAPSTFSILFRQLDIVAFEAALSRWVATRLPDNEELHIALDGKTARGSHDGDAPGQHLVSAYAPHIQAVLAQVRVDAKTNEHKAALELLGILPIRGNLFSGDAMFCQRDVCAKIVAEGGDYVFFAKDNQPSLVTDLRAGLAYETQARQSAAAFSPSGSRGCVGAERVATSIDKGHGRLEKRTLRVTTILTKGSQWAGLRQGFELTRERTQKGKTTVETVHGISSLSPERADAKRLLDLTRGHWGIENGLHYRRDVTMGEDQSRVRKGGAPQVMAALRNGVIHVLRDTMKNNLAAALRTMNNRLAQALTFLGFNQCD